jgi:hypothetical protein
MMFNLVRLRPAAVVLGTLVALLSVSAYSGIVQVTNDIQADSLGLSSPLGGESNGDIKGSSDQKDNRGGDAAIVMSLKECKKKTQCQQLWQVAVYGVLQGATGRRPSKRIEKK